MPNYLVVVESPAKAKTIKRFLGRKYKVKASMGHLIDLPKSHLGIDIEKDFQPKYITIRGKGNILKELKKESKKASSVYLAADPDREGEAICWHLKNVLQNTNNQFYRVQFNEITKNAIKNAFNNPGEIDINRVEAQQARRILDRLVGYLISPLLWRKVKKGLSAGRVQSVAVRLVCDREKEIEAFTPEEYWSIEAMLTVDREDNSFPAKFYGKKEKKINISSRAEAEKILQELNNQTFVVKNIKVRERKRNPPPPFTTSSMQQEAVKKLGFTTKKVMAVAQQLYEGINVPEEKGTIGMITYIRTDSTRISSEAQGAAKEYIVSKFGANYYPKQPRKYTSDKKSQDAHEAIRPTSPWRDPEKVKSYLNEDQFKLYVLIWERFIASQMSAAVLEQKTVDIACGDYYFKVTGSTMLFPGFMSVSKPSQEKTKDEIVLPKMKENQELKLLAIEPSQHFTQPPPRYTEATLVKTLEKKGIGRPSTYAPIIDTILSRGYVRKIDKALHPTELGFLVVDLLKDYFPEIIDISFTAQMEEKLDLIEEGNLDRHQDLKDFYSPFRQRLEIAEKEIE